MAARRRAPRHPVRAEDTGATVQRLECEMYGDRYIYRRSGRYVDGQKLVLTNPNTGASPSIWIGVLSAALDPWGY
jgi:hypothetical protein